MKKEKSERLFDAMGGINDRFIDEAVGKKREVPMMRRMIALAASIAIVIGLSLYLFIPINDAPVLTAYEGAEYYPIISRLANYYYRPHNNKNNFEKLLAALDGFGKAFAPTEDMNTQPPMSNESAAPEYGASSSDGYFEVTDNQVAGVIEADLIKASKTHLYRISSTRGVGRISFNLKIFDLAAESGAEPITALELPVPDGMRVIWGQRAEMYLSSDLKTVTVIVTVNNFNDRPSTAVYTVDVSDVTDPSITNTVLLSGAYNTSRRIGEKILVVTKYGVRRGEIDYENPETFIPKYNAGEGSTLVPMEDIVMPEDISSVNYSVLMLLDEKGGEPTDTLALFDYTNAIYVTETGVFAANSHTERVYLDSDNKNSAYLAKSVTEIAHISFDDGLTLMGKMKADGSVKDQYSLDEKDGFLRLVTTTDVRERNGGYVRVTNAALYIFDLSDHSERRSIKYFAPDWEEAASVRFDGDILYVCTAEIVKLTDPVYFFDLSDYDNITSTDTGTIDGYSNTLIQLGNGYLLGVGYDENRRAKLEVYKDGEGGVVSTDKLVFNGYYSETYKSYLVNRELGIFGMSIESFSIEDENGKTTYYNDAYVTFRITDGEIAVCTVTEYDSKVLESDRTRAFIMNGIIYISTDETLIKEYLPQ